MNELKKSNTFHSHIQENFKFQMERKNFTEMRNSLQSCNSIGPGSVLDKLAVA
jgi:hypothetical protein